MKRVRAELRGTVQGVGFRPRAVRLARAAGLTGWVANGPDGVRLELQGPDDAVDATLDAIAAAPAPAQVLACDRVAVATLVGELDFRIAASELTDAAALSIPPDLATCPRCLADVADPHSHFAGHPFASCTACGPRWSILEQQPFDRERSAMAPFPLCETCAAAYGDVADRRFHAQAFACPEHGPTLSCDLACAERELRGGGVVALKGLGGFQLLADARSEAAVGRLRERKGRPDKPLAVMWPSLAGVEAAFEVSDGDRRALSSPAAPIVLLRVRTPESPVAVAVTRGRDRVGVMLPTTALHQLLLRGVGFALVCTSANRTGDPIPAVWTEHQTDLADVVVDHDRPILRPVDDSVVSGGTLLRLGRGYAPVSLAVPPGEPVLGVGPHLKATVAVARGLRAWVGPHIGDLTHRGSLDRHEQACVDLCRLLSVQRPIVACDAHPSYASTRLAERLAGDWGAPLLRVQHHHAHVAAVAAEHGCDGPVLGLAWDGAGHGDDGTTWGSEALIVHGATFERLAHLRPFGLPGGDACARKPYRVAASLALELADELDGAQDVLAQLIAHAGGREVDTLRQMLATGTRVARSTAMGRLFDGVAFLAGLDATCTYEAQAAMALEDRAEEGLRGGVSGAYPLPGGDWRPLVAAIVEDRRRGACAVTIATRFHLALVDWVEAIAAERPELPIALAGGCFQNAVLLRLVRARLTHRRVLTPRALPPNDGAISYGQVVVARHRLREEAG